MQELAPFALPNWPVYEDNERDGGFQEAQINGNKE